MQMIVDTNSSQPCCSDFIRLGPVPTGAGAFTPGWDSGTGIHKSSRCFSCAARREPHGFRCWHSGGHQMASSINFETSWSHCNFVAKQSICESLFLTTTPVTKACVTLTLPTISSETVPSTRQLDPVGSTALTGGY